MPKPRPPSRIEPLHFPVFGLTWWADPGTSASIVAYCGGGGSAKTGVHNSIVVVEGDRGARSIATGDQVGVALYMFQNATSKVVWLVVGMGNQVRRYRMPDGQHEGTIDVGEAVNALTVNSMADLLAVGCETGAVKVYEISDERFRAEGIQGSVVDHEKTVCALVFSLRNNRLMTSAKDGTACIYENGQLMTRFKCSVSDDSQPKPARPPQVLVRGCAFTDLDGRVAVTVASGRRGAAFLARWQETPKGFQCRDRVKCNDNPVSAMSLSADGSMLALGTVEGSILLWNMAEFRPLQQFKEVHELPVTCLAARPVSVPLEGEEHDNVMIHVRSASADSQLACLTMQRHAKKRATPSDASLVWRIWTMLTRFLYMMIVAMLLSPVVQEAKLKCGSTAGLGSWRQCLVESVLLAPKDHPGILKPPY